MSYVLLKICNMGIAAIWLILAVIVLRLIFRRAPKMTRYILWALVAFRLVCPISFESTVSLIPSAETFPESVLEDPHSVPVINSGVPIIDTAVKPVLIRTFAADTEHSGGTQDRIEGYQIILACGTLAMFGYGIVSYAMIRYRVRSAMRIRENLWICDEIGSPFILGVFRPRIYLPSDISEDQLAAVEAHERMHLRHMDHLWKPFGFAILAVYWWNPLVWAAYILFCRDIELACDEAVVRGMESHERRTYSEALLSLSIPKKLVSVCPLAFGEVGVKSRIKAVLNYRKPAVWVIAVVIITCAIAAVLFLTDPFADDPFMYDRIEVRTRGVFIGEQESVSIEIVEGRTYALPGYSDTEKLTCTVESADPKTKEVVLKFDKPLEFTSGNSQTYTLTMDLDFDPNTDDSMDGQVLRTSNEYSSVYYFNHCMIKGSSDSGNPTEPTDDGAIIDTAEGDINRDGEYETLVLRKSDFSDHFSFVLEASGEKLGKLRTVFVDLEESELSFIDTGGRLQVKAVSDGGARLIDIVPSDPYIFLVDWDNYSQPAFPSYGDDKVSYSICIDPKPYRSLSDDELNKWSSVYFEALEAGEKCVLSGDEYGKDVTFTIEKIDRNSVTFTFSETLLFGRNRAPVNTLTMDFASYDDAVLVLSDGNEDLVTYRISPAISYNRIVWHDYDQDVESPPLDLYMFPQEVFDYAYKNADQTVTGDVDGDGRGEVVSIRYDDVMDIYDYNITDIRSLSISAMEGGVGEYFTVFLVRDPENVTLKTDDNGDVMICYKDEPMEIEVEDTQIQFPYSDYLIYMNPSGYINSDPSLG